MSSFIHIILARRHEQIVFGCEVRIKDGKVAEISKAGNLRIDKNSVIVSAHGTNAKILEQLQIGDRASVQQTLGDTVADKAEVVLGAGPMLVEDGKRNVRSSVSRLPEILPMAELQEPLLG